MEGQIKLINSGDLPLDEERLRDLKGFCLMSKLNSRLIVGEKTGELICDLRKEYLDLSLPLPQRAIGHIKENPEIWRNKLIIACKETAKTLLNFVSRPDDLLVHYLWRAGIFFLPGFYDFGVNKHFHFGLRRDEKNPHKTAEIYLPLNNKIQQNLLRRQVVADVMLATGGSGMAIIDRLLEMGIKQRKIIFVCLIAAPEGVYNLLTKYPDITIIAGCLDDHLDVNAYIVPGLGDAGDKGFSDIALSFFHPYRKRFSASAWKLLENLINQATSSKHN